MSESEEERRPRPIGVADGSEDGNSDMEGNVAPAGAEETAPGTTGMAAPDETTAKKPSKKMPAFSENDLVKDKGLWQIYKDFPKKCRYKGKGREAEFLRGLMVAYKEWGYQLYPGVAFEDLASRTEKLGGKARTRDVMLELREAERDRAIEANYGRAAVDDVRALEAAKLNAKESRTAAAREGEAEEREDEELAGSRYMEVEEEEGAAPRPSSSAGVGGGGEGRKEGGGNGGQPAAVLSEQVRQRMEVNRRLALERLRLKKEEAAAAAAGAAAAALGKEDQTVGAGATATPVVDTNTDLMDVDGGGEGGTDDAFEDEEAALAEMEADQTAAPTAKSPASAGTSPAHTAAVPFPATPAAAATQFADTARDVDPERMASAESTTRKGDAVNGESDSAPSGAPATVIDDTASATASDVCGEAAGRPAEDTTPTGAGATLEPGKPASGSSGEEDKACADDGGDASRGGTGSFATAGNPAEGSTSATKDDEAGAAEPAAAKGDEQEPSFGSPTKSKPAGGLPLSPLGNMFASTDVPAEGGSIAVGAPLGGLFSDESTNPSV